MKFKGVQKIQVAGTQGIAQIVQQECAFSGGLQIQLRVMIVLHFHVAFPGAADVINTETGIRSVFRMFHCRKSLLPFLTEKCDGTFQQ